MQEQYKAMQELLERSPHSPTEGAAIANVYADMFWLYRESGVAGAAPESDPLDNLEQFRIKASKGLAFADQCYRERNQDGFRFCINAFSRARQWLNAPLILDEQCWVLRASIAQVSLVYGLMMTDNQLWDEGERCFAFARETAEKMDAAHRLEGVPAVVRGGLRWRTLLGACELRCRAWLYQVAPEGRPVYSPYEALGLLRSMPSGRSFSGQVQLAALQVAKYCLLNARDAFPTALAELSSRCELDFPAGVGAWRMFDSNALLDRQNKGRLDSYVFVELEMYKELESGRCSLAALERLWELRDRSLELFYPAGYELNTLRAVLDSQRRAMQLLCIDETRLRDAQ